MFFLSNCSGDAAQGKHFLSCTFNDAGVQKYAITTNKMQ